MMVQKRWDHQTIVVDQAWLDLAKELIREHGITETTRIAEILEERFAFGSYSRLAVQLIVIAMRETEEERLQPPKSQVAPDLIGLKIGGAEVAVSEEGHLVLVRSKLTPSQMVPTPAEVKERLNRLIKNQICVCRCQRGRHCGGCGHAGCGYTKSAWELKA